MFRRFLALAIACAWLAGCGGQSSAPLFSVPQASQLDLHRGVSPTGNSGELPEPPVVRSVNGVARVSLSVTYRLETQLPQFVFGGMSDTAPTIRVNPGDTIVLDVTDELPQREGDKFDINIHFHGLGASPRAPADDVLGTLARPGQALHYVVHVPQNQEPGLYWYHPHVHGETNYQVGEAGMSGAIVVNGLERHLPGLAKMKTHVIIVRDNVVGNAAQSRGAIVQPQVINSDPCGPEFGGETTLNDAYEPVITIAPGEKQFFRVINATGHKTLKLAVDGSNLEVVAIDGFPLDTWRATPPTLTESAAIVPPASRVEFVVTGPRSPRAKFWTLCYDSGPAGDRDPKLELASLKPPTSRPSLKFQAPELLRAAAALPQNVYTSQLPPVAAHRVVVFSEGNKHFFINHKAFSMSDPPMFVVHTGTVEEWLVKNITGEVHDFHIHQVHFLVREINSIKVPHPYWADSFIIPHRQSNGKAGTLLMLMDFRDPIIKGTFLFHCHILDHEDHGMMAKIQAIDL
ncbi:MAG: multicopper oxidase domain-containing protein [Candidatus Eremiobacteraeota bacterium]|nr:multicopper oxidase domain-containing protein [Candidatus Eremiobacteraeota bacterium]